MDVGDEAGELLGVGVVAREQDDAAHERMAQHFAVLGRQLETGDIDHQWPKGHKPHFLSSTATDSTCVVCGNISRTPAARKRKPMVVRQDAQVARQGARVTGDIHHPARGDMCHGAQNLTRPDPRRV